MKKYLLHKIRQFHRIRIKEIMLPAICLVAFLCGGCAYREPGGGAAVSSEDVPVGRIVPMESTPIVNYTVPQLSPNVLVDRNGYQTQSGKRAAVRGRKLPRTFNLIDADTKEVVFAGELEDIDYSGESELYSAYADFRDWKRSGNYYLECEYIGQSYRFTLQDDLYRSLFDELCAEKAGRLQERTITVAEVTQILLAYEWYADIFPDGDQNAIPDILEEIALWINATKEQAAPAGEEAAYAAALAKFSYLYQKFDRKYATECLKRASVVYDQAQNSLQKDAECFHALTELYRASGLETYHRQLTEYRDYFENHSNFAEERGYLYGAMTYLSTRQKVNVELCGIFMNTVMGEGERISGLYKGLTHPAAAHNNGADDLLNHALELACANYVMENYQYNQIMEEFWHYLNGRNSQSVNFYALRTAGETDGGYLILLAQLVAVGENL